MFCLLLDLVHCQQARVKVILYKGLLKLVILEPHISSAVFDLLWAHFIPFYEEVTQSCNSL